MSKYTLVLDEEEANLILAWAEEELKKPDAVAAALVLKRATDRRLEDWCREKWSRPRLVKHPVVTRGGGIGLGGMVLTNYKPMEGDAFAHAWNKCKNTNELFIELDLGAWVRERGRDAMSKVLSQTATRMRRDGWNLKRRQRGRRRGEQ
jgi:hypothetical protein